MSNTQNEAVATTTLPTEALQPNDYNPNQMTDERFAELVEEIQHLGRLPKPIVARPNGDDQYIIVDGEHGWRAAQAAGLTEIAVEVVELDDFESRRQTYKRNQHGDNNPVLLGRMFCQMMDERDLSQRALAKEITVSEGTVRNALLYAQAAEMRNGYARTKELEETAEASATLVAGLSVRRVRYYAQLPQMSGGFWLDAGADMKVLLGVKTEENVEATDRQIEDAAGNVGKHYKHLETTGLFEFAPTPSGANSFKKTVETIEQWNQWEHKWTWGMDGNCLSIKQLRPYTKHYFKGVFYVRDEHLMTNALNIIINTETKPPSFYLTPEEFENIIADCNLMARQSASSFREHLGMAVCAKGFTPEKREYGVRWKLMQDAIDEGAPEYIRESKLYLPSKYLLWKTPGGEEAKQILAKKDYLHGKGKTDQEEVKNALREVEDELEGEAQTKAERARLFERFNTTSQQDLATSLAEKLFGEVYEETPDALRKVAKRLAGLEKTEILALDEFVTSEQKVRAWAAAIRDLAEMAGIGR